MAHLKGLSYPSAGRDIKAYPHILFLAALCGMQDFSSPTRGQICVPAMGVPKFSHQTSRESSVQFSSVQFSRSVVSDSFWPHESQHTRPPCPSQTPGVYSKLMPIESVMPSSHLVLCRPFLLLPPIPPNITVFSNESTPRMRWPKYWSFSFSIGPSNEHPGFISFRMDWLDLLAVQGTLKSLLHPQAYLMLLHFALLHFADTGFSTYFRFVVTMSNKPIGIIFPTELF